MKTLVTLVSAILLLASTLSWAEANDETDAQQTDQNKDIDSSSTPPTADVQSTTSAGSPERTTSKNRKAGDIFQPSEEISEDFAVSFPVDI